MVLNVASDLQQAQQTVAEQFYVEEECAGCNGKGTCRETCVYHAHLLSQSWEQHATAAFMWLHTPCNGTGRVRRWPMRMECGDIVSIYELCHTTEPHLCPGNLHWYGKHSPECCCHGLGWLPCEDAMVLWRESNLQGMKRWFQEGKHGWKFDWPAYTINRRTYSGAVFIETDDPELALWQAAAQYVERSA